MSFAQESSGDAVAFAPGAIGLPTGYVSLSDLFSTITFLNATIDSVGLDRGVFTTTFGANTLTVTVGSSVVPLPGALSVFLVGLAGLAGARRRRLKVKQS